MPALLDRLKTALADRYTIQEELGAGGMATVYLAEDLKHHRQVAVKVLRPELAAILGGERFLKEIEVTANLQHPHILPLYDSGEADGFLFYVMPYVPGESLRDWLDRDKQLAIDDVVKITSDVASALSFAHENNVVHRDIKPENILMQAGHAMVADFGVARAVKAAGDATRLTGTGMALGTPAYFSPEQATAESALDGRSDVYALGCVVYEMLAGQPPFAGPTVESVIHQHLTAPPPLVSQVRSKLPQAVGTTIDKALAKTPADRFPTASGFAEALERASARPQTAPRSGAGRFFGIAAAVALALGGGWWFLSSGDAGPATIAVLAPDNTAVGVEDQIFADGMHEELLNSLAGISGFGVSGLPSVLYYRDHPKPVDEIARDLGAQAVVQMSVRRQGDNLRISVQLIDGESQQQLWSQAYNRQYSASEVFAIQEDVARQIAGELQVQITGDEQVRLGEALTENTEAYNLYLLALSSRSLPGSPGDGYRARAASLRQVVALDPEFAAAWAKLSDVLLLLVVDYDAYDLADEALAAREKADELAPLAFETLTMNATWIYRSDYDLDSARTLLLDALRLRPSDQAVLHRLGQLERRAGNWDASLNYFYRALEFDPVSLDIINNIVVTQLWVRDWVEGRRMMDRYMTLSGGVMPLNWGVPAGDLEAYRRWADSMMYTFSPRFAARVRRVIADYEGDVETSLELSRAHFPNGHLAIAQGCYRIGDTVCQRAYADSVIASAENNLLTLEQSPIPLWRNSWMGEYVRLARAHAFLGDRDAALDWAVKARELLPRSVDAYTAGAALDALAEVYTFFGEYAAALATLDTLLAGPARVNIGLLRIDPSYKPLWELPGFHGLVEKYGNQ